MKALIFAVVLAASLTGAPAVHAQTPPGGTAEEPAVTPFELQRLFDSYALLQAQDQLKINDEQYGRFLPRFKALQDARRQTQQQRARVLQDIRRLLADGSTDEAQLRDRLKQMQEIESRGQTEARKAYDAIDQVLDLRQQAQFRIFEEQMERRKIELVTRARQANRANRGQRQGERP
jgi:Spy/CpxP family protein refolding chaperone